MSDDEVLEFGDIAEDSRREVALMPNAEFRPIPSIRSQRAGNLAQDPEDQAFLKRALTELLAELLEARV